jgi:hypothetical protein
MRRRRGERPGRALRDVVVGGGQIVAAVLAAPVLRGRYNRWGATAAEVSAPMPGDDLVPTPKLGYTRAITVEAPPQAVWPWLVQIGQGRGGLYSFDGLENLVGCRIHSADRVLAEHQGLRPGDLVRLGPDGYPCFRVAELDGARTLVLIGADGRPPHRTADPSCGAGAATWQWQLQPIGGGSSTRLVVRQRLTYPFRLCLWWHIVEPIGFVMERQMLLGIKRRAEGRSRSAMSWGRPTSRNRRKAGPP